MKTLLYSAAILALAPIVDSVGFCDACAKSKRDCELCKVTTNQLSTEELRKSECESVRGPCFWNTNEEDANFLDGLNNGEWSCNRGGRLSSECNAGVVTPPPSPPPGPATNSPTHDPLSCGGDKGDSCNLPADCCSGVCKGNGVCK